MAITSEVQIANTALARVGSGQTIGALNEASQEARACNLFYAQVRDQLLEDHLWPFAQGYKSLGLVASAPDSEWAYAYEYPSDCLRPRRVLNVGTRIDEPETAVPFQVGAGAGVNVILCDLASPVLHYTLALTNPVLFSPAFADALGWRLAFEIAMPLTVTAAIRDRCWQQYLIAVGRGMANALDGGQGDPVPDAAWIRART